MLKVKDLLIAMAEEVYGSNISQSEAIEKTKAHYSLFSQAKVLAAINRNVESVMGGIVELSNLVGMMKDGDLKQKITPELLQRASEVAWRRKR